MCRLIIILKTRRRRLVVVVTRVRCECKNEEIFVRFEYIFGLSDKCLTKKKQFFFKGEIKVV